MWQWPSFMIPTFLYILAGTAIPQAWGSPSSTGPVSDEEAKILWQDGRSAFQERKFQQSVNRLERFVDRYPGHEGYLEAHLLLGESWLALGKTDKAIPLLKKYISARSTDPDSGPARLTLGQAYLRQKKWNEALLVTLEVENLNRDDKPLETDVLLENLFLKSSALLELHRESEALPVLDLAEQRLSETNSPAVHGKIYGLELKLRLHRCGLFPGPDPLDEGQFKDQIARRGLCLTESLFLYQKILAKADPDSAQDATQLVQKSFIQYDRACRSVPPSVLQATKTSDGAPRNARQRKRFEQELVDFLLVECRVKMKLAYEVMQTWTEKLTLQQTNLMNPVLTTLSQTAQMEPHPKLPPKKRP